jgi:hypothetical protein
MDIRVLACELAEGVDAFKAKAREFFYRVMLIGRHCPRCGGRLAIISEGMCRCVCCKKEFDPTVAFQRCLACGGIPALQVRRYQCRECGGDIASKFLFDGMVFDAEYFRARMSQSRQRKYEQRERVRQMLAESRSGVLCLGQADLDAMPGLVNALNALSAEVDDIATVVPGVEFDLRQYERHIQTHIHNDPLSLTEIPPLHWDTRRDLVWRFIAVLFLAHAGLVDIWQEGHDIMVIKHETDRERQDIPGEPEAADGVERPLGGTEAC